MPQERRAVWSELVPILLCLALLVGTFGLVLSAYRRTEPPPGKTPPAVVVAAPAPPPPPEPETTAEPAPAPPPPIDLTPDRLREIAARRDAEKAGADASDARASAMEAAVRSADAETKKWRTREGLIRSEVAAREADARRAEDKAEALARERDMLASARDQAKDKLQNASLRARDGVAVLPYKGPNGTWRRPIALECRANSVTLQPKGRSFSLDELTGFGRPRVHPLVMEVAKAMLRCRDLATPDGMPTSPYLMFLVRPDGVKSYYAARALLEPLGIAYGYELADADWDIEFPDLDDPSEWAGLPGTGPTPTWPPASGGGIQAENGDATGGGRSFSGTGRQVAIGGNLPDTGYGGIGGVGGNSVSENGQVGRALPSPGDGRGLSGPAAIPEERTPWGNRGRSISRGGSGGGGWGGSESEAEANSVLEALSRGRNPGREVPDDGRVSLRPGMGTPSPRFDPAPPSNEASDTGSGVGMPPLAVRGVPNNSMVGDSPQSGSPARGLPQPAGNRDSASPNPASSTGRLPAVAGRAAGHTQETSQNPAQDGSVPGQPPIEEPPPLVAGSPSPATTTGDATSPGNAAKTSSDLATGSAPPVVDGSVRQNSGDQSPSGRVSIAETATKPSSSPPGSPTSSSSGAPSSKMPSTSASNSATSPVPISLGMAGSAGHQDHSRITGLDSRSIDMSVTCGAEGLTIHPGGKLIAKAVVMGDDAIMVKELRKIVADRYDKTPGLALRPKLKFLVKPGGEAVYRKARLQFSQSGTPWPTTLQLADRASVRPFSAEKR